MKLNPKLYHIALILYCLIIFIFSSIPGDNFPIVDFEFSDKIVHIIIYSALFILFFYSLKNQTKSVKLQKFALEYSLLFTALYGVTDEIHQYFVPNRSCEFYDWLADFLGALIFYLIFKVYYSKKKNLAVTMILFFLLGCSGSYNFAQNNNVKVFLEETESWIDFMPTSDPSQNLNRFYFVIKLKVINKFLDTNYTVKNFIINLNNDNLINKRFNKGYEVINDSAFLMTIITAQNEKYLDKQKEYPQEVNFSFDLYKSNKKIKTIKTPTIKIGRTE